MGLIERAQEGITQHTEKLKKLRRSGGTLYQQEITKANWLPPRLSIKDIPNF
jgi:hypothetical protein